MTHRNVNYGQNRLARTGIKNEAFIDGKLHVYLHQHDNVSKKCIREISWAMREKITC